LVDARVIHPCLAADIEAELWSCIREEVDRLLKAKGLGTLGLLQHLPEHPSAEDLTHGLAARAAQSGHYVHFSEGERSLASHSYVPCGVDTENLLSASSVFVDDWRRVVVAAEASLLRKLEMIGVTHQLISQVRAWTVLSHISLGPSWTASAVS
jgi:hypothetical protein